MNPPPDTPLHWRVTAHGLQPRFFLTRLDAHRYAVARAHLNPTTTWRVVHPNHATGPWHELDSEEVGA